MLTLEEVQCLIQDHESDRVELTQSMKDTDKFAQAICAFANDLPDHRRPGYLIIGIDNQGQPTGLEVTDQLLQNLAAIRSDGNIQPLPVINVQKYSFPSGKGDIAVVETLPSDMPPVRYKGRVYIRVGPRKAIASEQEERILTERRTAYAKTFDSRPCLDSKIDDLSVNLFLNEYLPFAVSKEVIEENNRTVEEQMASLRFYDPQYNCPTNAGMILFGEDPLRWLPGAYIQFVRFDGAGLEADAKNELRFTGDLRTVLQQITQFIPLQIEAYPKLENAFREKMIHDYPTFAIREFLMNAVMHRSYEGSTAPIRFYWFSDHIEIQNPGSLYGDVTPDNFPRQNSYRNPVIAEAMKTLGYVNKFGGGVSRAQAALQKNGNLEAKFEFRDTFFLVKMERNQ